MYLPLVKNTLTKKQKAIVGKHVENKNNNKGPQSALVNMAMSLLLIGTFLKNLYILIRPLQMN